MYKINLGGNLMALETKLKEKELKIETISLPEDFVITPYNAKETIYEKLNKKDRPYDAWCKHSD
mgnify:CR=1 FL=1